MKITLRNKREYKVENVTVDIEDDPILLLNTESGIFFFIEAETINEAYRLKNLIEDKSEMRMDSLFRQNEISKIKLGSTTLYGKKGEVISPS
jgi:hypothetical protein